MVFKSNLSKIIVIALKWMFIGEFRVTKLTFIRKGFY